jgi:hypothetical protein
VLVDRSLSPAEEQIARALARALVDEYRRYERIHLRPAGKQDGGVVLENSELKTDAGARVTAADVTEETVAT